MRRAIASILLAFISFPLMGAAMAARFGSSPACCRRDGKHHCEMAVSETDGPGINSAKCASWGNPATALLDLQPVVPVMETQRYSPIAATGIVQFQVARATVNSSHSLPKRGPPSLLR